MSLYPKAQPTQGNKVKLTIWVDPPVAEALKVMVQRAGDGSSVSQVANTLLHNATQAEGIQDVANLVLHRIEHRIEKAVARMADRVAYLSAAAALESATTRRVLGADLIKRHGKEKVLEWSKEARADSSRALAQASQDLLKLLYEVAPGAKVPAGEREEEQEAEG